MTIDLAGICAIFWYLLCNVYSKHLLQSLIHLLKSFPVSSVGITNFGLSIFFSSLFCSLSSFFSCHLTSPTHSPPFSSISLSWFRVTGWLLWSAIKHIAYSHPCRIHTYKQKDVCRTPFVHWAISFDQAAFLLITVYYAKINFTCIKFSQVCWEFLLTSDRH